MMKFSEKYFSSKNQYFVKEIEESFQEYSVSILFSTNIN
jgi:hypothetical protein